MLLIVLVCGERHLAEVHLRYHLKFFLAYSDRNLLILKDLNIVSIIYAIDSTVVFIEGTFAGAAWRAVVGTISSQNRCNLVWSTITFARTAHTTRLQRDLSKFGQAFLFLLLRALLQRGSQIVKYRVRIGKVI